MVERGSCKQLISLPHVLRLMLLLLTVSLLSDVSENGEVQKTVIHTIDSEACVFKYIRVGYSFKKWKVKHMLYASYHNYANMMISLTQYGYNFSV